MRFAKVSFGVKVIAVLLMGAVLIIIFRANQSAQFFRDIIGVLSDQRIIAIYLRTLGIAFSTALVCFVLGLALSYFLHEVKLPGNKFFQIVYFWPFMLPPYFLATAWLAWLGNFGVLKGLNLNLNTPAGVVFLLSLHFSPIIMIAITNMLGDHEADQKEIALLMGKQGKYIWRIWLPRVLPAAGSGALLVFILTIHNYSIPSILGVNTISTEIYAEFGAFYNFYRALVKIIPVVVLIFLLLFLGRGYLWRSFANLNLTWRNYPQDERCGSRWVGFGLWSFYILLVFFLPFLGLELQIKSLSNIWNSITLAWDQIWFSLWFNAIAAIFIVIPAFLLAYLQSRRYITNAFPVLIIIFASPPVFLAIVLIYLLNHAGFNFISQSGLLLYLGYVLRFLPLVFILVLPVLATIPRELEEVSWLSGRTFWQTWRRILLPLAFPSLLLVWLVSFFFCHGEAECSILLYPPGAETIAMRTLSLLHYGTGPVVNGLVFTQMILLGVIAFGCIGCYRYWRQRWEMKERSQR
ncbi:MAG TPA: ABC transporter permease subunit [Bacillota bacterium]|nr:ABC transporter permease subunit [Bacillota bacterium]